MKLNNEFRSCRKVCDDVRPLDCSQTFFRVLFRGITGSVERHLSNEIDQMIFSNELISFMPTAKLILSHLCQGSRHSYCCTFLFNCFFVVVWKQWKQKTIGIPNLFLFKKIKFSSKFLVQICTYCGKNIPFKLRNFPIHVWRAPMAGLLDKITQMQYLLKWMITIIQ